MCNQQAAYNRHTCKYGVRIHAPTSTSSSWRWLPRRRSGAIITNIPPSPTPYSVCTSHSAVTKISHKRKHVMCAVCVVFPVRRLRSPASQLASQPARQPAASNPLAVVTSRF